MAYSFNVAKVSTLPSTYAANTMYLVPNSDNSHLDIYVSNLDGSSIKGIITSQDVAASIKPEVLTFDTYLAMTSSSNPVIPVLAYVTDASGDTTLNPVITGDALYIWDTSATTPSWVRLTNNKVSWNNLINVPSYITGLDTVTDSLTNEVYLTFQGKKLEYVNEDTSIVLAAEQW